MIDWLLTRNIIDGILPWTIWTATGLLALGLLLRRWNRRRIRRVLTGTLIGAVFGFGICVVLDASNALDVPLPPGTAAWATGGFAVLGLAIVSLWDSKTARKVVAVITILAALLSTTLGINAAFGIDRTLGDFLGVSGLPQAEHLQAPVSDRTPDQPLYRSWHPPAGMPKQGEVRQLSGTMRIPSTAGFIPRDAAIYLPPAALVADAPALPVVVQMMGLPGSPTPTAVKTAVDAFAAKHDGLGPIVIVADQLGAADQNPGCVDSKAFGGVETYFNTDIPAWIRSNVRALPGPRYWAISGYSNGGACSFLYGARHPDIWGALVSISGEEFPGMESPEPVLTQVYGKDQAAFEASKPENVLPVVLARHPDAYRAHIALFTAGSEDAVYSAAAERAAQHARDAGFTTTFTSIPGAGHVGTALSGGLDAALGMLAPVWGLTS